MNEIFRSGKCLSKSELIAYMNGDLKGAGQNRIERHLLDCQLCQEAIEGFRKHPNPIDLLNDIGKLKFNWP